MSSPLIDAAKAPSIAYGEKDWDNVRSALVGGGSAAAVRQVHHAVAASLAAENASRLAAMHAAQRSIEERLDALHAQFHLQRQTAITTELLDIVSGYEALTGRSVADHH